MREPKLVILDLDWTVWRGNCQNAHGPFVRTDEDTAHDAEDQQWSLFPGVRPLVMYLRERRISMAVASAAPSRSNAVYLLKCLGLYGCFVEVLVQPMGRSKAWHMEQLRLRTGLQYMDMLFMDDSDAFVSSALALGVAAVRVQRGHGASLELYHSALRNHFHTRNQNIRAYYTLAPRPSPSGGESSRAGGSATEVIAPQSTAARECDAEGPGTADGTIDTVAGGVPVAETASPARESLLDTLSDPTATIQVAENSSLDNTVSAKRKRRRASESGAEADAVSPDVKAARVAGVGVARTPERRVQQMLRMGPDSSRGRAETESGPGAVLKPVAAAAVVGEDVEWACAVCTYGGVSSMPSYCVVDLVLK